MPLQSSGEIKFSQIAAEFGDTAPHSMSDFYRNGNAGVDSSRAINVTATKNSNGGSSNFGGVSGLTVTRGTVSITVSPTALSSISVSGGGGSGNGYSSVARVTVPAGYFDFSIAYSGRVSNRSNAKGVGYTDTQNGMYSRTSSWATTFGNTTRSGSKSGHQSGFKFYPAVEIQSGNSQSNFTLTGAVWRDADTRAVGSTGLNCSNPGNPVVAGQDRTSTRSNSGTLRLRGTATQTTIFKMICQHNKGSNGASAPSSTSGWSVGGSVSSTGYDYSVTNNTGVSGTANGTSVSNGSTVLISNDNSSSSLSVGWASTETLNSSVPTSGQIRFNNFYSAENA